MQRYHISKHHSFYCIGLSYEKANAEIRGRFSLNNTARQHLLNDATSVGIEEIIVISTCNRTEIYGFAEHPFQLIKLLCKHSNGTVEEFEKVASIYKNNEAIHHMFRVGTGLESQILGDFEIIGQLKKSVLASKKLNLLNAFLERLTNNVITASKRVKTETEISSGATSVSFASVQYILNNVEQVSNKNILLFGTGKIGRNTCDNLVKHTNNKYITLVNRTKDKALEVAGKFDVTVADYADLQAEIKKADILIVATGAQLPTVDKDIILNDKPLLILDLSIPKNVSNNVQDLENVSLIHLDDLSQITDDTLQKRKAQVPQAESIIIEFEKEFKTWLETRKFAPTIKALKSKLEAIKLEEIDYQRKKIVDFNEDQALLISNRIVQKITKQFANHLKDNDISSDESIKLISKVFQLNE
ncbi:glutamyl-tRNA reductase [Aureibaculum sp. 2210JD6-5]|uniref:glutamyl-tRNA reductase n=1 Tax=Aureibaculum sp. 2210JD6-5 TaxID=3103957 RepID=UPI002AACC011|nr:glutamyl-tRNA reductase [Aureibaculum sp. 2210JD6-5]MDY7395208.1 glutamyl-tRNA reductase [Aureibaculum sp. 2210JD6-5]